jgi:hypothetical protein
MMYVHLRTLSLSYTLLLKQQFFFYTSGNFSIILVSEEHSTFTCGRIPVHKFKQSMEVSFL